MLLCALLPPGYADLLFIVVGIVAFERSVDADMEASVRRVFWLGAEIAHTAEETSANLTE